MSVNPCLFGLAACTTLCDTDILQDRLSGIRVRPENFSDLLPATPGRFHRLPDVLDVPYLPHWDYTKTPTVPFTVLVYDDGLDYDADGNAYFDDYPHDYPSSYHRTRKGAECAASWLEFRGIAPHRISIQEYLPVDSIDYELGRFKLED